MDILEAIRRHGRIGVSALAREAGLNVATVHNIVSTLAARNYLFNEGGQIGVGPSLASFGSYRQMERILPRLASGALLEVAETTGESPILASLDGMALRVMASTLRADRLMVEFPDKTVNDPLSFGTGVCLVAFSAESLWGAFIEQHHPEPGQRRRRPEAWRKVFRRVRRDGHAVVHRPKGPDSVAMPLRGPGDAVLASIGVSFSRERFTPEARESALDALRAAAADIEPRLGAADRHGAVEDAVAS